MRTLIGIVFGSSPSVSQTNAPLALFAPLVCGWALLGCQPTGGGEGGGPSGGAGGSVVNTCPAHTGPGTTHAARADADETWAAADSPHIVTAAFSVAKEATVTIEPCAEVRLQPGGTTVNGNLVADGTPDHPITITSDDAAKPFSYIRSFGYIDMANVHITRGGAAGDPNGLAVIDVRGDSTTAPQAALRMVDVTIDGSEQWGVSLRAGATFTPDSKGLTIKNTALEPIRAEAPLVGAIPAGSYTGNALDQILVVSDAAILSDTTWHDRGVPYRLGDQQGNGGDLRIGGSTVGQLATLTLESGVTIKVVKNGRILVSSTGSDSAATGAIAATNATFTSAEPAPAAGDWVGLYFNGTTAPTTKLDGVHVEYAGGPSYAKSFHCGTNGTLDEPEDAAIIVLSGSTSNGFVTNSTILASAGYGIDRGWRGGEADFVANNTFTQIARCKESFPRQTDGGCPQSVACP